MKITWIVALITVTLSVQAANAQSDPRLPEGPNRELITRNCSACHDLSHLFSTAGRSREGWRRTLEDMTRFGLVVSPEERALILNYLSTYLAP
jgi:mono/diheme cytochrome c family protein